MSVCGGEDSKGDLPLSYRRHLNKTLQFWHARNGHEVDFVIENDIAIEVKTTHTASKKHMKSLKMLQEENLFKRYILVSHDKIHRKENGIKYLFWADFLTLLWNDKLLSHEQ